MRTALGFTSVRVFLHDMVPSPPPPHHTHVAAVQCLGRVRRLLASGFTTVCWKDRRTDVSHQRRGWGVGPARVTLICPSHLISLMTPYDILAFPCFCTGAHR